MNHPFIIIAWAKTRKINNIEGEHLGTLYRYFDFDFDLKSKQIIFKDRIFNFLINKIWDVNDTIQLASPDFTIIIAYTLEISINFERINNIYTSKTQGPVTI